MKMNNYLFQSITQKVSALAVMLLVSMGLTAQTFSLLTPPDQTSLTVEGVASDTVLVSWQSDTLTTTLYSWVLLNSLTQDTLVQLPSDNNGVDTTLSLTKGAIDNLFESQSVPLNTTVPLQWYVVSTDGITTNLSDTFGLSLTRGVVASNFNLTFPPNNLLLDVAGNGSNTVDITWENSGTGVTYAWWLDLAGGDFSNPLVVVPSNNSGTDTALTLDYATIKTVLNAANVPLNDTANLQWTVSAFAGNDTLLANTVNNIDLINGPVANAYDLASPANNTLLNVAGNSTNTVDITWNNAGEGVTYAWWLDAQGGNFTNPIVVVPSNNNGADTMLTLDFATIQTVLNNANVPLGDTANLSWTVSAFSGSDTLLASSVYDISLINGAVANPFNLVSPPNNTFLKVEGPGSNTIDITWENAGANVTYAWWVDVAGGNFSNPIAVLPSNNMGMDTALTLDLASIDALLAGAGLNIGDTVNLQWNVSAFSGSDTLLANNTFFIDLERGVVAKEFDLKTPPNNTLLEVAGNSTTTIDIEWEESGESVTYAWWLDVAGGNFTNPLAVVTSNANGFDSTLTLDFATIDGLLAGAGLSIGDTANLQWTVSAFTPNDTVLANSVYNIDLIRGAIANPFDLVSPPNNTLLNVQGNATNSVDISWNNAGQGVTYAWWLDVAGGNFTTPLAVVNSNNGGADTVVTLDFATIDAVLTSAGVTIGDTANLQWTVSAFSGADTLLANNVYNIDLVRGNILESFDLQSPPNNTSLSVIGSGSQTVDISWTSSSAGATYYWVLDAQGGSFMNPIVTSLSNNAGADTVLTLDYATIDAVLAGAGVSVGSSATLDWTTYAVVGTDTLFANQVFGITLDRDGLYEPFDLLTPASGTAYNNQGLASQQINVTWNETSQNATYQWVLRTTGATPTVLANIPTGSDTSLVITFGDVEGILANAGVAPGGVVNLEWEVEATVGSNTLTSANGPFDLGIQRGEVIFDFDLLTPPDGFSATIEGDPNQAVNITWESAGENLEYKWLLDVPSGNFQSPIIVLPSGNNGADTALTLNFETLSGVLANAGVNVRDSANLIWTVRALGGGDSLQAAQFNLTLTRGEITSVKTIEGWTANVNVYPNPASEVLNIAFDNTSTEAIEYRVFNVTGKMLDQGVFTGQNSVEQINITELSSGMYFISLTKGDSNQVIRFSVE